MPRSGSTKDRGYGAPHQRQRARLLAALVDGTPCAHCGQPMTRDQPLDADHTNAIKNGGTVADRLLHASCNRSRKDGRRIETCDYHQDCGTIHSRDW